MKADRENLRGVYRDLDVEDLVLEAAIQVVQAAALLASRNREALLDLLQSDGSEAST